MEALEKEAVVNYFLIKKPKQGPGRRHREVGGLGALAGVSWVPRAARHS